MDGTKIKANASRHKAMSYGRMQTTEAELKAQIAVLLQKAANTDEAEKNEPDLDIPAELERRQARLAAITAAIARLEERQRQSDAQGGRSPDDERQPKDKDGKPKGGKPYQRDFVVPAPKAQDSFTDPESRNQEKRLDFLRMANGEWRMATCPSIRSGSVDLAEAPLVLPSPS